MTSGTNDLVKTLNDFLAKWNLETMEALTLKQYVGVGDKDTFCQWVETKTRMLGSIKGLTSIKFGIYERKTPSIKPKNYTNDETHSWLKEYGTDRNQAFARTKEDLLKTIQYAQSGNFKAIDELSLPDLFKWKVAFLYSNQRLIPIYKREVLSKIANHYDLVTNRKTKVSSIQEVMMAHKPAHLDVFQFMRQLYDQFGREQERKEIADTQPNQKGKRKRKGTNEISTAPQIRTLTASGTHVIEQKHKILQKNLKTQLDARYGEHNVQFETNYVDVRVEQSNFIAFYEVKTASYASECIKQALGQVLLYVHNDEDPRPKKIFVVGQYPANREDKRFIRYIQSQLQTEFDYIHINIE